MLIIKRVSPASIKNIRFPQRSQSNGRPTAPFGSRILQDPDKVFDHNMWDHMQRSQEEEKRAKEKVNENSLVRVQAASQDRYEKEASKYWNEFYKTHQSNFFKDRNWLFMEFPEILPEDEHKLCIKVDETTKKLREIENNQLYQKNPVVKLSSFQKFDICSDYSTANLQSVKQSGQEFPGCDAAYRILEVGCGAGNSVFPILKAMCNIPGVFLYCCDFASEAIELVKSHSIFDPSRCLAFVHNVCDDSSPYPFPDESLDIVLLIFVLSSINPGRTKGIVKRLARLLKPGGMILFRDYGRYDATQLRFKKGSCLSENFYVKRDGTRAYFFTKDETHNLFSSAGLTEVQNELDQRLKVNRKKKVKMHRVWIQSKFQKPLQLATSEQARKCCV